MRRSPRRNAGRRKNMRKIRSVIAAVLSVCFLLPQSVWADTGSTEFTFNPDRMGSITIDYKDADSESPVSGADFTLYKVADFTSEIQDTIKGQPAVGTPVKSIFSDLEITADTDPESIEEYVEKTYKLKEPENGAMYQVMTGDDGTGKLDNVELGIYLGVETHPADEYAASIPFLVSIPESLNNKNKNNPDAWNYDVTVYPKVLPLGDLKIVKKLEGNNTEKDREWHFVVSIDKAFADSNPDGAERINSTASSDSRFNTNSVTSSSNPDYGMTYDRIPETYTYERSTGEEGIMTSGDTLTLKGGESVIIKGIPIGAAYNVSETEANQDGYVTHVSKRNGTIREKDVQTVSFVNERNKQSIQTSDNQINMWYILAAATAAALIIFVIASNRKEKKKS